MTTRWFLFFLCLVKRRPQRKQEAFPGHLEHIGTDFSTRSFEIGSSRSAKLQYMSLSIDQHGGWSETA